MKMIIFIIAATGFFTSSVFADIILKTQPGEIYQSSGNEVNNYRSYSIPKDGVEVLKQNNVSYARYSPGTKTGFIVTGSGLENLGNDNLTVTTLIRINGQNGSMVPFSSGALSHTNPGYRLGVVVENGCFSIYAIVVFPSSTSQKKIYTTVTAKQTISINQNTWFVLTMSANRVGKLQIYINGELAGSESIRANEEENLYSKTPQFCILYYKPGVKSVISEMATFDIAELIVRNELIPSSQIYKEANEMICNIQK